MAGLRSKDRNIQIYGESARPLPAGQLPLYRDVDLAVEHHRMEGGLTERKAIETVASDIADLWRLTNISVSPSTSIIRKIQNLRKARTVVVKNLTTKKGVVSSSHTSRKGPGKKHKGGSKIELSAV